MREKEENGGSRLYDAFYKVDGVDAFFSSKVSTTPSMKFTYMLDRKSKRSLGSPQSHHRHPTQTIPEVNRTFNDHIAIVQSILLVNAIFDARWISRKEHYGKHEIA